MSLGANCLLEIPSCCTCTGFMCVNQQISDLPWRRSVYRVEEEVIALEGFQWSPDLTFSLGLVGFLLSQKWELCGGCQQVWDACAAESSGNSHMHHVAVAFGSQGFLAASALLGSRDRGSLCPCLFPSHSPCCSPVPVFREC